jgi:hypothetical protein
MVTYIPTRTCVLASRTGSSTVRGGTTSHVPSARVTTHADISCGGKGLPVAVTLVPDYPETQIPLKKMLDLHQLAMCTSPGIVRVFQDEHNFQPALGIVLERMKVTLQDLVSKLVLIVEFCIARGHAHA